MLKLSFVLVLLLPLHVATESVGEEARPVFFHRVDVGEVMGALAGDRGKLSAFNITIPDRIEYSITLFSVAVKKVPKHGCVPMNVPVVAKYSLRFEDIYRHALVCEHVGHGAEFAHIHKDQSTPSTCPKWYDKGHLAPAKALSWSGLSRDATYLFKNQVCQLGEVNRQVWKDLEKLARLMSWVNTAATIDVYVGPFGSEVTWLEEGCNDVPIFNNLYMCVVCVENCWWPLYNGGNPSGFLFCMGHDNTIAHPPAPPPPPPPKGRKPAPPPPPKLCPTMSNQTPPDNHGHVPQLLGTLRRELDGLQQQHASITAEIKAKEDLLASSAGISPDATSASRADDPAPAPLIAAPPPLSAAQMELIAAQTKVHAAQAKVHAAQAKVHEAQSKVHEAQASVTAAQDELKAQKKSRAGQTKISAAQNVLNAAQNVLKDAQKQLSAEKAERDEAQNELRAAQTELSNVQPNANKSKRDERGTSGFESKGGKQAPKREKPAPATPEQELKDLWGRLGIVEKQITATESRRILTEEWQKNQRPKPVQTGVERICFHTSDIEDKLRDALNLDPSKPVHLLPKDIVLSLLFGKPKETFETGQMPWKQPLVEYLKSTLSGDTAQIDVEAYVNEKKSNAETRSKKLIKGLPCVNQQEENED